MSETVDIIKYDNDNSALVWKHPSEDFKTGSQLIVHESQEAIFFMNGQALDLFGAGRHTLTTQNLPMVGKFFNLATSGDKDKTPFHCEVYFINKAEQMTIKWGTDSEIEYVEPTYGFPLQIGASGEMSLRVDNSRKLLVKIVGMERVLSQQSLTQKFRMFLMGRFKPYLARFIHEQKINIFEIDENLLSISEAMQKQLAPDFLDYGISLEHFFVLRIVQPEDNRLYQRFKELHFRQYADITDAKLRQQVDVIEQDTQRQRMILEAQGIAAKRALEGYSYQDERGFDVAERVASNETVAKYSNLGMGLGVMAGVGGTVGGAVTNTLRNTLNPQQPQQTPAPMAIPISVPTASPAPQVTQTIVSAPAQPPTPVPVAPASKANPDEGMKEFEQRLKKLEMLKGKIPDDLYDAKMRQIIDSI
jgi:membrane protease subunit (stomatin/prohibitin family)